MYHRKGEITTPESAERGLKLKKVLKSVKVLLTNPTFMFLNLAAACEGTSLLLYS